MEENKNKIEETLDDIKRYLHGIRYDVSDTMHIDKNDLNDIKETIRSTRVRIGIRTGFILVFIIIASLFLFEVIRSESRVGLLGASNRILMVSFEDLLEDADCSDSTQVENALKSGGQIRIKDTNDGYQHAFGSEYGMYGASDASNMHYTKGAALNYIASKGWVLVQAPTTALGTTYYFNRETPVRVNF